MTYIDNPRDCDKILTKYGIDFRYADLIIPRRVWENIKLNTDCLEAINYMWNEFDTGFFVCGRNKKYGVNK